MRWRVLLAVVAALALLALSVAVALGEDAPGVKIVEKGDTFPAALGYAVLGLVTAAGGTLGVVIKLQDRRILKLTKELAEEKDARRQEAEKLLREQQTLLREVLTAVNSKTVGYGKLTDAVQGQTLTIQHLMSLIGEK